MLEQHHILCTHEELNSQPAQIRAIRRHLRSPLGFPFIQVTSHTRICHDYQPFVAFHGLSPQPGGKKKLFPLASTTTINDERNVAGTGQRESVCGRMEKERKSSAEKTTKQKMLKNTAVNKLKMNEELVGESWGWRVEAHRIIKLDFPHKKIIYIHCEESSTNYGKLKHSNLREFGLWPYVHYSGVGAVHHGWW